MSILTKLLKIEEKFEGEEDFIKFLNYSSSKEMQLQYVETYPNIIFYIKNPSEEVKLAAVKNCGEAIRFIKNPSKELQLEAIKQFPEILDYINYYIKNPCQEALDLAIIKDIIE